MAPRDPKFVIKEGRGPNASKRVVLVGGNGEPILTGEGYKGGTAAALKAIEKIKAQVAKAKIVLPKPPAKKVVKGK